MASLVLGFAYFETLFIWVSRIRQCIPVDGLAWCVSRVKRKWIKAAATWEECGGWVYVEW